MWRRYERLIGRKFNCRNTSRFDRLICRKNRFWHLAVELRQKIAENHCVIVVEHDMTFVRDLDVRVTVLHEGRVLAEGSLDQVSANQDVIDVYLGR